MKLSEGWRAEVTPLEAGISDSLLGRNAPFRGWKIGALYSFEVGGGSECYL